MFFLNSVKEILERYEIEIKSILHIGAHKCEELVTYKKWNINPHNVVWIDANESLVKYNKDNNVPNVFNAVIDATEHMVIFNIANNGESSSILELGSHEKDYPSINYIDKQIVKTTTIPKFMSTHNLDPTEFNFWNLDIQGAELGALTGATSLLQYVDVIYVEVNTQEVYKECGLIWDIDKLLSVYGLHRVATYMTSAGWGDAVYVRIIPFGKVNY